jgi:hypothetical protein
MNKFYKREVSLMNTKVFPRDSLDKPINNPDINNSIKAVPVMKSDQEIVNEVVSNLKKTGKK